MGAGIPRGELQAKFRPFMHSNKIQDPQERLFLHGKNGRGRLTFFKFSESAEWHTVYKHNSTEHRCYQIHINSDDIDNFKATPEISVCESLGTTVNFAGIIELSSSDIPELDNFISHTFASFLESKTPCERKILINGTVVNYDSLKAESKQFDEEIDGNIFHIHYVRWSEKILNEYSKFYFIDSDNTEKARKNTSF